MLNPPFKLAGAEAAPSGVLARIYRPVECCDHPEHAAGAEPAWAPKARTRLADMDTHLHCSVLGTCLATADLRKLMRRFIDVQGATDVEVHHDAVSLASQGGLAAKALHKALDQRHDAVVQRFAKARDEQALTALWDEALHSGEIPGAYWAVLTHRDLTPDLRKKVFGDVHMLSHLVGAANRADIRRLVALERENTELRDRLERQQGRSQSLLEERDEALARVEAQRLQHDAADVPVQPASQLDELEAAAAQVGLHTERRERAEQAAALAHAELASLREATHTLNRQLDALTRELAAAETQLEQG
ncbi:MAG: hypothetical protein JWP52_3845, partial [Rhizobacter sp.]|nr:hypothetical protein [Rhizobacter sp.]